MKTLVVSIVLASALPAALAKPSSETTLMKCTLGAKQKSVVAVIADHPIADSNRILIKVGQNSKAEPIFGLHDDASRGTNLSLKCIGKGERVLLVAGEFFGSGYPKGIALRYHGGRLERIDFAERALPKWIDLTESDTRLIFSEHGPEFAAPLVSYRFVTGIGQVQEPEGITELRPLESGTRIEVQPSAKK